MTLVGNRYRPRRRTLMLAAAWCPLIAWAGEAGSQSKKAPFMIGYLAVGGSAGNVARNVAVLKEGLVSLGWKEGAQFVIETRTADGQIERLPALAHELAKLKPAVVVVGALSTARHMSKAAPDIPIVQAGGANPVQAGLAKSLARPGGMVTGITQMSVELSEKLIELLVEVAPKVKCVGVFLYGRVQNRSLWLDPTRRAAAQYGVEVHFAYPAKAEEIEPATTDLARQGAQALIVIAHPFLNSERTRIIAAAQAQKWPIVSWTRVWVEQGALMSYGVDGVQHYRRAAYFVDRILKGARPGDLPIEQPMNFELAVNMKSARALGLTVPPTILVRATHVIE